MDGHTHIYRFTQHIHIRARCTHTLCQSHKLLLLWMICFSASNYSKSLFIKAEHKDFKFLRPPQSHRINWIEYAKLIDFQYHTSLSLPLYFSFFFLYLFSEFSSKRLRAYSELGGFFVVVQFIFIDMVGESILLFIQFRDFRNFYFQSPLFSFREFRIRIRIRKYNM